jgi:hypothetical protein
VTQPTVTDQVNRWLAIGSSVVAPVTLLTTLLFYFGYVSSRAQFRYFGIDVDTIGLSTSGYAMRSPAVLLVPLLMAALAGMTLLLLHVRVRRHPPSGRAVLQALALALLTLVAGLALLLGYFAFGRWPAYALVTPSLIGTGVALLTYLFWLPTAQPWLHPSEDDRARWVRPAVSALGAVVVGTCLFWATATLAEWTGRGNAVQTARNLDHLPLVILDTTERLYLTDGITSESVLPTGEGQSFRYRYRGLRLLVQGEDRMFLVPERWSANNSTIVVPVDDTVRLQFRFVNDPP